MNSAINAFNRKEIELSNKLMMEYDVFSTGVILYELFTGINPVEINFFNFQLTGKVNFDLEILKNKDLPEEIISLLKDILESEPGKMMTMKEAFNRYKVAIEGIPKNSL